MEAIFKKQNGALVPDHMEAAELLTKMPEGAYVKVCYSKKRNYENHKRFFAFLRIAFDNQDFYDDPKKFRQAIQMIGGHYDELIIQAADGSISTHYIPKSISFEEMDETEFQDLFAKCINGFIRRYGNGITEKEMLRLIEFD